MNSAPPTAPQIMLDVDDIPLSHPFSIRLAVCADSPVTSLTVDAVMPAHRHGMNYTAQVVEIENDAFQADNMLFHMPGHWRVLVDAKIGTHSISYTADFTVK